MRSLIRAGERFDQIFALRGLLFKRLLPAVENREMQGASERAVTEGRGASGKNSTKCNFSFEVLKKVNI